MGRTSLGGASCLPKVGLATAWAPGPGWAGLGWSAALGVWLFYGLSVPQLLPSLLIPVPARAPVEAARQQALVQPLQALPCGDTISLRSERLGSMWGWEPVSQDGLGGGCGILPRRAECVSTTGLWWGRGRVAFSDVALALPLSEASGGCSCGK